MKHTHSWKRYKDTQYYCTYPTCYVKMDISLLHGKLAQCNHCPDQFIIFPGHYDENNPFLNCGACSEKSNELTVSHVRSSLVDFVKNEVKEAIHEKLQALIKREKEVKTQEIAIQKQNAQLITWEKRLDIKHAENLNKLEERKKKILEMILRKRARLKEIKIREPKVIKVIAEPTIDVGELMLKGIANEITRSNSEE